MDEEGQTSATDSKMLSAASARNRRATTAAVLTVLLNCLALPVCSFVLVFSWRELIYRMYGYARYDPFLPVCLLLLVAVALNVMALVSLKAPKTRRGVLVGLGISLLLSPAVLFAMWISVVIGNR